MDKRELEAKIFDLIGYMTSSARNLMDETPLYGPFRLVDAASRLIAILEGAGIESPRLASLRREIDAGKYSVTATPAEFKAFLDALVDRFVDHLDEPPAV
ncbi:MAG: DUF6092 family protein [Candidatus Bipolaricaulis sp.]|nr:DUF6092 family protein [Candidatus Bipolaricaulis sp.]MDD5645887.1 DUF6092 family protein [Candidatus Bipolaricaulis sp.]